MKNYHQPPHTMPIWLWLKVIAHWKGRQSRSARVYSWSPTMMGNAFVDLELDGEMQSVLLFRDTSPPLLTHIPAQKRN
jgi:hypothetical protein